MDPIGASSTWHWEPYENAYVTIDGKKMPSIPGGGHHGGGMFINAWDMARFGYLFLNNGQWGGRQLISEKWIGMAKSPGPANGAYGYMNWFLNLPQGVSATDPGRRMYPAAPASAVAFRGNGENIDLHRLGERSGGRRALGGAIGGVFRQGGWGDRSLTTPRVHFEVRVLLEDAQGDVAAAPADREPFFGAAVGAAFPDRANQVEQRLARRAGAQRAAQVRAVLRVQAEQEHAVGGEPRAVARAAERLRSSTR